MLFSIIVPVYNVDKYVSKCIQSILEQNYQEWELILIDDGSEDTSGMICEKYAKSDSRIKVIHQSNYGVSSARNLGLKVAKGEYIIFVDADDWLDTKILAKYHEVLKKQRFDMVACDCYNVWRGESHEFIESANKWRGNGDRSLNQEELFYSILYCSATLWNKAFKQDVVSEVEFNSKMTFAEDTDFLVTVLFKIKTAWIMNYHGYYYFNNRQGNIVSEEINDRFIELLRNTKIIYDKLEKCPDNTIGVHRINMSVTQVLKRLPGSSFVNRKYDKYFLECKKLVKYPEKNRIQNYLRDSRFRKIQRIKYVFFLISIRLALVIQHFSLARR